MNGILGLELVEQDRVTRLVICGQLLFLFAHDLGFLFGADHDLDGRLLYLLHRDSLFVGSRGKQRRLVKKVFQIRARKARGGFRDGFQLDVGSKRLFARVHLEDSLTSVDVGIADDDLTVEASRTEQSRVKHVGTVCRGDEDNALVHAKAVHLNKQLVERLLTLVVAAAEACAPLSADSVDLVYKDDTGRVFLSLIEQVAHS